MNSPQIYQPEHFNPEGDYKEKFEFLKRKFDDLKAQKQKLLEYIQKKEKDHLQEQEALRQKLEQNKVTIRKLEDENISLRFEVLDLRQKETHFLTQLEEIKSLLRKYYLKAKQNDSQQKLNFQDNSFLAQAAKMNLTVLETEGPDSASQFGAPPRHPHSAITLKIPTPHKRRSSNFLTPGLHEAGRSFSYIGTFDKNGEDELRRRRSFQEGDDPSILDEPKLFVARSDPYAAEEKYERTFNPFISKSLKKEPRYSSPESEDSPRKKSKRKGSNQARNRSISLTLLGGKDCNFENFGLRIINLDLSKINTLSQNIVSLGVKPEIIVDYFEIEEKEESNQHSSKLRYIQKETPKASNLTSIAIPNEPQQVKESAKLFEHFFVVGADKNDLNDFINQHPGKKQVKLKPKILFRYPAKSLPQHEAAYNSIPDFVFPFGVPGFKLKSSPSFSALNPIIYISGDGNQRAKCFVFPLLSGSIFGKPAEMGKVVETANPNHLLYIVCITFKDFITLSNTNKTKKALKDIKYWEVNKVLCFMTYYPLTNFFFDTLVKLLDILKVERMMKLSQADNNDLARHETIDSQFTSKYFNNIVIKNLDDLLLFQNLNFASQCEFKLHGNFMETKVPLEIEEAPKASSMESSWACFSIFSYISLKDLLWFYALLMLERKLVFLSKNLYLLTGTLSVLHSLMKPFRYPFPLIFNLPEVLTVICDAPGAALIGINKSEEYLKDADLIANYPSCIYICLDEERVYIQNKEQIDTPSLGSLEKPLLTSYIKINPSLMRSFVPNKKLMEKFSQQRLIKYDGKPGEKIQSLEILETFGKKIQEKITNHLPESPIYDAQFPDHYDFLAIGDFIVKKAANVDKEFLNQFIKTQIFAYYIELYYETTAPPPPRKIK